MITGPKYCGKTTTAKTFCRSLHSFSTPAKIALYEPNIRMALRGETPVLIDEWQNIPRIWDEIRDEIDDRGGAFGQFILTGSVHPLDYEEIIHSGEGRFSRIIMRPFSLFESKESSGSISLASLFDAETKLFCEESETTLCDVAHYKNKEKEGFFRHVDLAERILASYARNISSEAPLSPIRSDISGNDKRKIDDETLSSYLAKLKGLFIIDDLPSWNPNLRSKTAIRSTQTRHFIDPSIASPSLGISPSDLLNDPHTLGLFFEDLAVRDLRIYADAIGSKVAHYRDADGLEVDAIVHKRNGDWGAIEIKLGSPEQIQKACSSLLSLKRKIDTNKLKSPSFLAVLTAAGSASTNEDGIHIFPLTMPKN